MKEYWKNSSETHWHHMIACKVGAFTRGHSGAFLTVINSSTVENVLIASKALKFIFTNDVLPASMSNCALHNELCASARTLVTVQGLSILMQTKCIRCNIYHTNAIDIRMQKKIFFDENRTKIYVAFQWQTQMRLEDRKYQVKNYYVNRKNVFFLTTLNTKCPLKNINANKRYQHNRVTMWNVSVSASFMCVFFISSHNYHSTRRNNKITL